MRLSKIAEVLEAEVISGKHLLDREIPCAFSCDLISDILKCTIEQTLLLTGLTNPQILRTAEMIDLLGIVIVRGKKLPKDVIEEAEIEKIPIMGTKFTMFEASGRLFKAGLRTCRIKRE